MVKMNKTKKCKNHATMQGLNKWYVSMFGLQLHMGK